MFRKAIENWLTNTNERRYQLPFVQVLIFEGHTIKYVSKHGQIEQGKDIISVDSSGIIWAYQLKTGDIDLSEWRKIKGEIVELAELSPVHASIPIGSPFRAVLVTNGKITDPVRQQIVQINQENDIKQRKVAHIEPVEIDELVGRFLKAQDRFVPMQPVDVNVFLKFYLATGEEFFEKNLFRDFLLNSCLIESAKSGTEAKHAVTSSIIMTAYLLRKYQEAKNHFAIFEAWVSLLGYICRFAAKRQMPKELIDDIGNMILNEIIEEMNSLEEEVLRRPKDVAFFEGETFGDGLLIYQARATITLGTLCAFHASSLIYNERNKNTERVLELLKVNLNKLWYWGESAFPYLYWIFRFLEQTVNSETAIPLILTMVDTIIATSQDPNAWLPSPYVSSEEVIKKHYGMIPPTEESETEPRNMGSYILRSLVEIIARRNGRQLLEKRWKGISHIFALEHIPNDIYDVFLWRTENGKNDSRPFEKTQSWQKLVDQSKAAGMLHTLKYECAKKILPFYILVAPHRATANIINYLEN